jgi:8-oxo-dGTP pyrophosphatase MutT (NUDIX family)
MTTYASVIAEVLRSIPDGDATEQAARDQVLTHVASGAPLTRISTDTPDPHLVSYFLLTDGEQVLMVDHRKSGLWLPTGGHVDAGEHPRDTALREVREELGIAGDLLSPDPLFLTAQRTQNGPPHTDISLWYAMRGDVQASYDWDPQEFHSIRWFLPGDIPLARTDPNLPRFLAKLYRLGLLRNQEVEG